METPKLTTEGSAERREQIRQDVLFVRMWLEQMAQTRVQRWREDGEQPFLNEAEVRAMNESVAEHVGQMKGLALEIIDKAVFERDYSFNDFDLRLALRMIRTHDAEEIITGDVRTKDAAHFKRENEAIETIKNKALELNYGHQIAEAMAAYREKKVAEARFVKAIDELQAWFYIINSRRFDVSTRDFSHPESIAGYVYSQEFPTLHRVMDLVLRIMRNPECIKSGVPEMELLKEQYS
ncbi:MAG: hypothetical protein RLZZ76_109 [Candidatus Parcubacteria bacterium]|jgi:5'-deoxynucleotidase YfbR-like HD superfamily hydrolase